MQKVIDFLRNVRRNNNREWFEANRASYLEARSEFEAFAAKLLDGIALFDESVRGLTLKDCTYRFNRDTRFSPNKDPYKTHFGVYICSGGKKSGMAGYYFHIEPSGGDFAGGYLMSAGIYMPEPGVLKAIREEIFDRGDELTANIAMAETCGFTVDRSNSLKRTPAGYPTGSRWDDLLRLKDLYVEKFPGEDYILGEGLLERVLDDYRSTFGFVSQLNRSVVLAREAY